MGATTDTAATLGYLARALKAPTIGRVWEDLAITARGEGWSHEEYLSLIHISEPTRRYAISYAVFCLKKKKK